MHRGVLVRQPTGTGKTFVSAVIAKQWFERIENPRVLIIAHEQSLVNQLWVEFRKFFPHRHVGMEMSESEIHPLEMPEIVIASRQTIMERKLGEETLSRLYKFSTRYSWLVVTDEAHRYRAGLKTVGNIVSHFNANSRTRWLGLTATPARADKISIRSIFTGVALDYAYRAPKGKPSALEDGWLVPCKVMSVKVKGIAEALRQKKTQKQIDGASESFFAEAHKVMSLVKQLIDLAGDRKTIAFFGSVRVAKDVANVINRLNHEKEERGEQLHGEARPIFGAMTDEEKKITINQHKANRFQFLCAVGMCQEGYDDPGIACVGLFRFTKHYGRVEQMIGRGVRPLKGVLDAHQEGTAEDRKQAIASSRKPDCLILDMLGTSGLLSFATAEAILNSGKEDYSSVLGDRSRPRDGDRESIDAREIRERDRKRAKDIAGSGVEVEIEAKPVELGQNTVSRTDISRGPRATEKQVQYLVRLGVEERNASRLSRREASLKINNLKMLQKLDREAKNAIKKSATTSQSNTPTSEQILFLAERGIEVPATYAEASAMIHQIKRQPRL